MTVEREELAALLFAADWPNDKWCRLTQTNNTRQRYCNLADVALANLRTRLSEADKRIATLSTRIATLEAALREWLSAEDEWECDRASDDRIHEAKKRARAALASQPDAPVDVAEECARPDEIAAAWKAWHARHGGKLGPGPAFAEAINAAFAVRFGKGRT